MHFTIQDMCKIMETEHDLWEQKKGVRCKLDKYDYACTYLDPKFHQDPAKFHLLKDKFQTEAVNYWETLYAMVVPRSSRTH